MKKILELGEFENVHSKLSKKSARVLYGGKKDNNQTTVLLKALKEEDFEDRLILWKE